ncbi:MAG: redoxin domain-containing protein [Ferrovum sp.]|jgi:peroxiredoxin Q/BCP|nr:redoxin domain-containing protein [Ferrovum sp.]NDU89608.1 peroxiredoxin [Ferrovum sp.]
MKIAVALFMLLISVMWVMRSANASELPGVGQKAPEFSVMDQNGKLQKLSDYQGKWLVLYFYPKDETPGCTTEACAYRDDIHKIQNLGAAVVGVSIDDASSHAEFADKHHLPFPLLADKEGTVAKSYGSERTLLGYKLARRNTFIIDPTGRIAKVYVDVDAEANPREVIVDLHRLQSTH